MCTAKDFQYEDENVCDTLFTLACQCGCVGMLRFLMEQHKAEKRYAKLGSYSLDILKTIKDVPSGSLSSDDLVRLYFSAATTDDHEKKLDFLAANSFDIEIGGRERGSIQKEFTFFKPRYEIDYNGWRCEGDFMNWNYDVYAACSVVIHISKELFHWGDTYVLDIMNPQDEIPALMLAVAIDAANCSQGN